MSTTTDEAIEAEWSPAVAQVIGEARLRKLVAEPYLERLIALCVVAETAPISAAGARKLIGSGRSVVHALVAEADHASDDDARAALEHAAELLDEAVRALAEVHERA